MKIKLGCHDADGDYIRHVRTETLKAVHANPTPESIQPVSVGQYLFAYADDSETPIGMTETVLLRDLFSGYEEGPQYCDLSQFCPFEQMASIRTVYVEPTSRNGLVYFSLTLAAARLCYDRGGRFVVATTRSSDTYLEKLYHNCGGTLAGTNEGVGLWVFDLYKSINHRAYKRLSDSFAFLDEPSPSRVVGETINS